MEEQEDEMGTMESGSTSSWLPAEGTLEQSVKVVAESDDAIYTAGVTSRLVLVPPPSTSSSDREPCELTVTFQHRLCHVHQVYVISTARICEIYGQKEEDGDRDYVCTVRGELISLSDDEGSADDFSEGLSDTADQSDFLVEDFNSSTNRSVPSSSIPEVKTGEEVQHQISPSDGQSTEVVTIGKKDLPQPFDDSPSLNGRNSKEELFRSFTEAINGRDVDSGIISEESLDHANWVECLHSPLKSSICTSDDEAEVDASTSEFYLIDTDVESQQSDQPQVRLFTDGIRTSGKNSISHSLEKGNTGSSGHSSWHEAIEDSVLEKELADVKLPDLSNPKRNRGEGHRAEESSEAPWARVEDFADDFNVENQPGSGFCVFEVSQDRDSGSSRGSKSTPRKATSDTDPLTYQVADASTLKTASQKNGDMESRFPVEAPVYECEVSLLDADAWTSVTIRLLSIKSKSQVEIHRVVVTYTPGPFIQQRDSTNKGPFQQGLGTSSLLTMLVPGILQMARGMSETRIAKNSSASGADKEVALSEVSPSKVMNAKLNSLPANLPTVGSDSDPVKMNKNDYKVVEEISSLGTSSSESVAQREAQVVTGKTSEDSEESLTVNIKTGHLEAHQKDDGVEQVVQRLDRLEMICLRMESSLNAALESMDKRLKLLESSDLGRMPPALGHPIWGPGFDSGSFVSATSVYVPAPHTAPGTPSLMDSQIPFSMASEVEMPVGEIAKNGVSATENPVYPGLLSSTSPPSLSAGLPSSWPQNFSHDSSSQSSGLTSSFISKSGRMNQSNGSLNGSDHPSNGGETFWESRNSEESESDVSSDSEQTSYADNCEDPACGCCPESLSSSPTKPAQLVDNALASALSAFSASFEVQNKSSCKEFYHSDEGSDEEESFTSEEQVPLVELDSFSSYYEKEEVVDGDTENVFVHGYQAIPLSSDKDIGDLSTSKVVLEDSFWSSEIEENQEIIWHDEGSQIQQEKIFRALEDCVETAEGIPTSQSDQASLPEPRTPDNAFSADLERVVRKGAAKETKEADDVGVDLEDQIQELQQNPFLQELAAEKHQKGRGVQSGWHEQSWTGDQAVIAKNVLSSCVTVKDLPNPLGYNEEVLQEGLFPDEWNWFTSEFSPFSSVVEVRDLVVDAPAEKEPVIVQKGTLNMLDGIFSNTSPTRFEPRSLLDDVSMPHTTEQHGSEQDGSEQKSQWSLLDEFPLDLIGEDKFPKVGSQDDSLGNTEPPSLLDEDIRLPLNMVADMDQNAHLFSSHESLLDDLTDVFRASSHVESSPSSEASKSNPFEDEHRERSDFSQGSNDTPLVLLEEFELETHQFEAPGSEGTQSLMFHMSL